MKKVSIFAPRYAKNGTYGAPNDCGNAVANLKISVHANGAEGNIFLTPGSTKSSKNFVSTRVAEGNICPTRVAASKVFFSIPGNGAAKNGKNLALIRGATGYTKSARTRGATIEYAVVFMVVVTVFIALILTLGMQSTKLSDRYNAYTDEKLLLDEIGTAATSAYRGRTESEISGSAPDLSALYADKLTLYGWSVEQTATAASGEEPAFRTVTVKKGDGVRLLVRFAAQSDGTYLLTQYTYGD